MSFDGAFLRHLIFELRDKILNSRVCRIYQPDKFHIILHLKSNSENFKLLISSSPNSPRVHLTKNNIENPQQPPMFCMLLRKYLSSARIIDLRQVDLERVLYIDFEAKNELGDAINLTLAIEILGRFSNIILIDSQNLIIDSIKRVSIDMSAMRPILSKIPYKPPISNKKISLMSDSVEKIVDEVLKFSDANELLFKVIAKVVTGISNNVAEEILTQIGIARTATLRDLDASNRVFLEEAVNKLVAIIRSVSGKPTMVLNDDKILKDFTFFSNKVNKKLYDSFSNLLDDYYYQKDRDERVRSRTLSLVKNLNTIISRNKLKIKKQLLELDECANKNKYKIYADLILANLHNIEKGAENIALRNFYSDNQEIISIKLINYLSPVQNANKYYKIYKKLCNAEKVLRLQIQKAQNDIDYLENVLDSLSRAENDMQFYEIYNQVVDEGYVKPPKISRKIRITPSKPLEFFSKDGFKILVGRNSLQNERLSLKLCKKDDIWFHVKGAPGAHTVLLTQGKMPSEQAIFEAAYICAMNSKYRNSSSAEVDYTKISNVRKIKGAKPGMVNYVNYKTINISLK